ncbi:hypothetical protein QQF64_003981 [Cirrhinus molitorella]|uniref:Uncharacterized protein n=1 Tax=Cirrhinus molitorella TaxID=172907 RepID=A0ABR3MMV5_9TELE
MFGQSSAQLFPLISFSMKERKKKIILYPKTGRKKGGKPSGSNQDLIVEAYSKSVKNLTAALVHSAWAAGRDFIEVNDIRIPRHYVRERKAYCKAEEKPAEM